jgi:hypothetical protein
MWQREEFDKKKFVDPKYNTVLKFCGFFSSSCFTSYEVLSTGVFSELPVIVLERLTEFQFCVSNSLIALLKDTLGKYQCTID